MNKNKHDITWPKDTAFTIAELWEINSGFKNITLRVRLANAIADGTVVELGNITGCQGRPKKVFAVTPVTQHVIDNSNLTNVHLQDTYQNLVTVMNVNSEHKTSLEFVPVASPMTTTVSPSMETTTEA